MRTTTRGQIVLLYEEKSNDLGKLGTWSLMDDYTIFNNLNGSCI